MALETLNLAKEKLLKSPNRINNTTVAKLRKRHSPKIKIIGSEDMRENFAMQKYTSYEKSFFTYTIRHNLLDKNRIKNYSHLLTSQNSLSKNLLLNFKNLFNLKTKTFKGFCKCNVFKYISVFGRLPNFSKLSLYDKKEHPATL